MSCPGTPEAGYSTVDTKLLRAILEAQERSKHEEQPVQDSHLRESFNSAVKEAEQDVQVSQAQSQYPFSVLIYALCINRPVSLV